MHHSVKQFLLGGSKDSKGIPFTLDDANNTMAHIIMTYLNYGVFGMQLSTIPIARKVMTGAAPSMIIHSTLDSTISGSARSIALKLLRFRKEPDYDKGKILSEASKVVKPRSADEFQFYSYARQFWICHGNITKETLETYGFAKLVQENIIEINAKDQTGCTLLSIAAQYGHESIVSLLLDGGKVNPNSMDQKNHTALWLAGKFGHLGIVRLLLSTGRIDPEAPFSNAVRDGQLGVVKLLLNTGKVNPDLVDYYHKTPLLVAAESGYDGIVRLLLDTGKVDPDFKDMHGRTPLSQAILRGHLDVIKLLLHTGKIDVNLKSLEGQTPLMLAVEYGQQSSITELLLETGKVDVNIKDRGGRTAFWRASQRGHETMVKMLLETGKVDIDSIVSSLRMRIKNHGESNHDGIIKLLRSHLQHLHPKTYGGFSRPNSFDSPTTPLSALTC